MTTTPVYPQNNAFRTSADSGGYWQFQPDPDDRGFEQAWQGQALSDPCLITVPGAWNEQLAERGLMNYVGAAWYQTELQLPVLLTEGRRVFVRFGAADHHATVWLNGTELGVNRGGYLPFEVELTPAWKSGQANRLTVRVDSRLDMTTLPQTVDPKAAPYTDKSYDRRHSYPAGRFDFFPYGGLCRPVYLQTTAEQRITRLDVDARLGGSVQVSLDAEAGDGSSVNLSLLDPSGAEVAAATVAVRQGWAAAELQVEGVQAWSPASPHCYTVRAVLAHDGIPIDEVEDQFGFREISVDGGRLLLNGEPLFLTGFGKHEDFPVLGHGHFRAAYLRDFELLRWIGANSFRTSHYPYDEEIMRLADRLGFLVIDEVPAVSLGFESDDWEVLQPLLQTHQGFLERLIARDRNRPSVVSWSIVNEAHLWSEPNYRNPTTERYFTALYDAVKAADPSRPVISITCAVHEEDDPALVAADLIGLNRYYAWYDMPAELEEAAARLDRVLEAHWKRHGKPIVMTEYGADTIDGYHSTFPQLFTEEYQEVFLAAYSEVLENKPYVVGTHVWNFADFRTGQHHRRVVHNRKGVFTRVREPKRAAFALRDRWKSLERVAASHRPAQAVDGYLVPDLKKPH